MKKQFKGRINIGLAAYWQRCPRGGPKIGPDLRSSVVRDTGIEPVSIRILYTVAEQAQKASDLLTRQTVAFTRLDHN
jgi:hypothetical protein